jgi:hypothetical protein
VNAGQKRQAVKGTKFPRLTLRSALDRSVASWYDEFVCSFHFPYLSLIPSHNHPNLPQNVFVIA